MVRSGFISGTEKVEPLNNSIKAVVVFLTTLAVGSEMVLNCHTQLTSSKVQQDGHPIGYASLSMVAYTSLILVNTFTLIAESKYSLFVSCSNCCRNLTMINHIVIWGTLFVYFITMVIANAIADESFYWIMFTLYSSPMYWFGVVV